MKEERAWRWIGLILLALNWLISFVALHYAVLGLGLVGLIPAILLTIAWKWGRKNPVALRRMVPGIGLSAFISWVMLQAMPTATRCNFSSNTTWFALTPLLPYLGLAIAVMIMARTKTVNEVHAPHRPVLIELLSYVIWANLLSMATLSSGWTFVGALVLGAATLAAWRFAPGRPVLAFGVAATQVAALVALIYGLNEFSTTLSFIFQVAFSVSGLLLAAMSVIAVRVFKPREKPPQPHLLSRPAWWALSVAVGIMVGIGGIAASYQYFFPDDLPTTVYEGPMKVVQMGRMELKIPEDVSRFWLSVTAAWPEGEVSINEIMFADGEPHSEQFDKAVDWAVDPKWQIKIGGAAENPNAEKTRTVKVVDEYFQCPARLVSGGSSNEIKLLIALPAGYLKFRYNPPLSAAELRRRPHLNVDRETWLIEKAREVIKFYTWTGRQASGDGFKTTYGVIRPEPTAAFKLYFTGYFDSDNPDYDFTLYSAEWHEELDVKLHGRDSQQRKQLLLKFALQDVANGKFTKTRFRPLTVAGISGEEHLNLKYSRAKPGNKTSLRITWAKYPYLSHYAREPIMVVFNNLDGDADVAARLGLWEAIAASVRNLDEQPLETSAGSANRGVAEK